VPRDVQKAETPGRETKEEREGRKSWRSHRKRRKLVLSRRRRIVTRTEGVA
jgi:hypothetical protein